MSNYESSQQNARRATERESSTNSVQRIKNPKSRISTPRIRTQRISTQPVHNRILAILSHTTRYAFKGESRLAADSGISKSALNRVVTGQSSPSFALMAALTRALEKQLGRRLDPREIVSLDGTYPTPTVCELVGCRGCLPAAAYDADERIYPAYREAVPGQWSGSVEPRPKTVPQKSEPPEGHPKSVVDSCPLPPDAPESNTATPIPFPRALIRLEAA